MKALFAAAGTACGVLSGFAIGTAVGTVVGLLTVVSFVLRVFTDREHARDAMHRLVEMDHLFDTFFDTVDRRLIAQNADRRHAD